jgi:hypothetical protein
VFANTIGKVVSHGGTGFPQPISQRRVRKPSDQTINSTGAA